MTGHVWGGRPPAGDDVMAHLTRADFGLGHFWSFLAHGRLDGWFPRFMVGHQEYLFYGPGFTWLLGLLRLVTFGLLSTTGAMKVLALVSFAAFGPAAIFLARSIGLSAAASAVAGVLALAVNNVFGVGLSAMFGIGLVPQQVAAVFSLLALGAALRTLTDDPEPPGRPSWRWPVLCAGSLAAVALIHVITVFIVIVFVAFLLAALLATERPRAATWRRLLIAGAAAVGVTAFWVVPFLAHRDLRGPVTTWATPPIG